MKKEASEANPELALCFEEAERTFSLDKDCSRLVAEDSSEESDPEEATLTPTAAQEDTADDSVYESFFTDTYLALPVCKPSLQSMSLNTEISAVNYLKLSLTWLSWGN